MTDDIILQAIFKRMDSGKPDAAVYEDAFACIRNIGEETGTPQIESNHLLMNRISRAMLSAGGDIGFMERMYELYKWSLIYTAPYCFDDFARAIEYDRKADKKFYAPRRHYLKPMIQGYQDILDGKLRLLTVSMPKRAGKSQVEILFTLLISGLYPDKSSLMEGTGDDLVRSFYAGCLEYLLTPNEYNYYDIFPDAKLVQTNADLKTINLNRKTRFPTIMCRSIDSRQVGLSEATNALLLDDCVEGREEAKNRQRLDDKWEIISGDIMGRAIEGTPMIFTGTRYSIYDPIGRIQEHAQREGWNWRAIEIPALDPETDESNYEYERDGKKVFTTAYFREQRELLTAEQFESEFQQQPFEAKGLLFNREDLNYYFELPVDTDPDAVVAICDTAEKGSDSTALGIFALYGADVYLVDVVFDPAPPEVTKPQCAKKMIEHKVTSAVFESNNAGEYYARDVGDIIRDAGYKCSIRTKRTISNKQTRIEMASDGIIKHFYFKHASRYPKSSQYADFMREVTTYTRTGKVPHDDAPDMLSLAENEFRKLGTAKIEIIERPW